MPGILPAPLGRTFSNSYLAGESAAHAFFSPDFRDRERRRQRAALAGERSIATALLRLLREQLGTRGPCRAQAANLDALAAGGAAVVVTGQQVGLFLGPLYSFYKAASAVAVARVLSEQTGIRCVPLFWLQTEDHDFAEIRTSVVPGPDYAPLRLTLADESPDRARSSVAHRVLPAQVGELLDQLAVALPPGGAAEETLALLRSAYQPGRPLAEAFAEVLGALFAEDGLLVLDPRRQEVAELAAPLFRACLDDTDLLAERLRQRGTGLVAAGFAEQVPIREHAALVCFHPDGVAGPRFRLERRPNDTWTMAGAPGTLASAELAAILERDPLRFSTTSLLRPIVQDALLPTAAYVAGPGEINYFAQLGPLYEHFGLVPPLLVPRARFRCLDGRSRRWLEELGLRADDLASPPAELALRLPVRRPPGAADPQALRRLAESRIAPTVEEIAAAIEMAEPGLRRETQRARARVAYRMERVIARYARALVERDQALTGKLRRLAQFLFPDGAPQERVYGWPAMAGRVGVAGFKRLVQAQLGDPFVSTQQDLQL